MLYGDCSHVNKIPGGTVSDELNELRSEMQRLQSRIDEYETAAEPPVGRRNMLRALGAAGAGAAVGGLAFAKPTSAADPNDVVKGAQNNVTNPTRIVPTAAYTPTPPVGGFHVTNDPSVENIQVAGSCISAVADQSKDGGWSTAFAAKSSTYGAKLDAPTPLKLLDTSNSGPPGTNGYPGQFKVSGGSLYFCVKANLVGAEAVWKKIVGPEDDPVVPPVATPNVFTPVTPFRVYDSRLDTGGGIPGPLATGANRVIPVRDARKVSDGSVETANAVPAGATAVTFYVAAIGANASGFLTVSPSDATEVTAASLNFPGGAPIGSGGVTKLAGDREVKVFVGGAAGVAAGFTIDVTGYYM